MLHQRASAWYEQHGLPADAIRHALAAKDFARAADLVELAWPAMDGRFQAATWLGWVKALPDELVRARPVLSVAYAWALLNGGELEAAEADCGMPNGGWTRRQRAVSDRKPHQPEMVPRWSSWTKRSFGLSCVDRHCPCLPGPSARRYPRLREVRPAGARPLTRGRPSPARTGRCAPGARILGERRPGGSPPHACRCHGWFSEGRQPAFRHQWHLWPGGYQDAQGRLREAVRIYGRHCSLRWRRASLCCAARQTSMWG